MLSLILMILTYLLFFGICVVRYTVYHLLEDIQVTGFNQILLNLNQEESSTEVWIEAIQGFFEMYGTEVLIGLFLCIAACALCIYYYRKKKQHARRFEAWSDKTQKALTCTAAGMFAIASVGIIYTADDALNDLGYYTYKEQMANTDSTWFDTYYTNTADVQITFPENKKNLIYIFMESMEVSYSSQEYGGAYADDNFIPCLTQAALENNDFGNGKTLNGFYAPINTTWTVAGMVAQTSGEPLLSYNDNFGGFSEDVTFMPNTTTLGEILEDNGYKNYLMIGSKASYGGRANYFQQHGNYTIYDYWWAIDNHLLPSDDYYVWWGYEDMYLYEFAKDQILEAASQDEPFNFTMLTVDTHFNDGYECALCEHNYDWSMDNVMLCADHQVELFVEWIQQQDFYEDTVIIIAGDHCSMDKTLKQQLADYDRKVYFTIINGPEYNGTIREFSTLDVFPTTVAALGAEIDGDRLGLGVNLFSDKPTLIEEIGLDELNDQIPRAAKFFQQEFIDGSGNVLFDSESYGEEMTASLDEESEEGQ